MPRVTDSYPPAIRAIQERVLHPATFPEKPFVMPLWDAVEPFALPPGEPWWQSLSMWVLIGSVAAGLGMLFCAA